MKLQPESESRGSNGLAGAFKNVSQVYYCPDKFTLTPGLAFFMG